MGQAGEVLRKVAGLLAAVCLGMASPARAEWLEVSSNHFVVYANDNVANARRVSEQLERYHAVLEFLLSARLATPSPSNRVTVFVVNGEQEVRRLYGEGAKYIGGFYLPRAGSSVAFVPRVKAGTGVVDESMLVLLHEYAHHFMWTANTFAMPRWLSEGGAEFFASASFGDDGSMGIGRAANHRAGELLFAADVTAIQLLDPDAYEKGKSYDAFYGKSWLLYHYLTFHAERKGQMQAYMRLLTDGKTMREAAVGAFGDLVVLEKDLDRYMNQRRIQMLKVNASVLPTGPVAIRPLRPGEAAMMPVRLRSRRGVTVEEAKALVPQARAIAARFPGDAAVLAALAEAEHDADNDALAVAAADAALAIDPGEVNAHVQKGLSLFRMAESGSEGDAAFNRARSAFLALNRIENDNPLPLVYNYRILLSQGRRPSPRAVEGLARAVDLAPFDMGLRMMLAMQQLRDGAPAAARAALTPVAFNPHGGSLAEAARKVLSRMDSDPKWDGAGFNPDAQDAD